MKKNKEHEYDETDETRTDYTSTDEEDMTQTDEDEYTSYTQQDEEPDDENMTQTGDEADEVEKKKSSKLPLIIGAVLIVGGGALGYNLFFNKHQNVPPQSQPVQQPKSGDVAPEKTPEVVSPPTSSTPEVQQPEKSSSIPNSAVEPNTTPNALPDLGAPVSPVNQGVNTPPTVQPPVVENQSTQPVVNNQIPTTPGVAENQSSENPFANAQTQAPQESVSAPAIKNDVVQSPVVNNAPVVDSDGVAKITQSIDRLIDRMDGFEDSIDKIANSVDDLKKSDTSQDQKIADLESRVSKLEEAAKNTTVVPVVKEVKKEAVVKKSTAKKQAVKKVVRKRHHEANSVILISDGSDYGRPVESKRAVTHKSVSHVSSRAGSGYELQAIVSGKAWVKRPNGTTAVYGIGDILPNGNKVGKIDPNTGLYDSAGKLWISE